MAKKKINIKSVTADVPSGDVNITYNNVRIAGLSESVEATLETEDTICEHDIVVDYTKPTPAAFSIPIYTKIGDGNENLFATSTNKPGELFHENGRPGAHGQVSGVYWGGENLITYAAGVKTASDGRDLDVYFYQPNAIPENANRIVITLTGA